MKKLFLSCVMLIGLWFNGQSQYISEILEYVPAPGQLINEQSWGTPSAANTIIGGVTGHLSLGAWGGYVVFRFENPVLNHINHPFGIDFTIFGNPLPDWSEPGIVWVMKDENENGIPDETWYELAGSDYYFSNTLKNYEVTYTNPNQETAFNVPWSDNFGLNGYIYTNAIHTQPYYPLASNFPHISTNYYSLFGTRINPIVDSTTLMTKVYKRGFGYADNVNRGQEPWTKPDNPYTLEKENSGGDGFDINWAVDHTGNHVSLDKIHFIKVQNGMLAHGGRLGEISTEICGAVQVSPNATITGEEQMIVIQDLPAVIQHHEIQLRAYAFNRGLPQTNETILWSTETAGASINPDGLLQITNSGSITVHATLVSNPNITATATTKVDFESGIIVKPFLPLLLYPNPAAEFINLNESVGELIIFNIQGKQIQKEQLNGNPIHIGNLPIGLYIVQLNHNQNIKATKLFKTY